MQVLQKLLESPQNKLFNKLSFRFSRTKITELLIALTKIAFDYSPRLVDKKNLSSFHKHGNNNRAMTLGILHFKSRLNEDLYKRAETFFVKPFSLAFNSKEVKL